MSFKKTIGTVLLVIDPQIDFHPGGSLAVPGANEDSERIASLIVENLSNINEIYVTQDSHYVCRILFSFKL
jgi:nicotinamidase-related amidase